MIGTVAATDSTFVKHIAVTITLLSRDPTASTFICSSRTTAHTTLVKCIALTVTGTFSYVGTSTFIDRPGSIAHTTFI